MCTHSELTSMNIIKFPHDRTICPSFYTLRKQRLFIPNQSPSL